MAVEIELKVRLDDPEAVKQRLSSLGTYRRSYTKNDVYWTAEGGTIPPAGIRIRRESGARPDGRIHETVLVTYKTKETQAGVEINDEREFTIAGTDPGTSAAGIFEDMLERLGLKPGVKKEKRGWAWTLGGDPPMLAELSLVKDLGWFLEIEILAGDRDGRTLAESRERLLSALAELDISPERIESRPYTEMFKVARMRD
jgi:predicted adenylyl cyclase CyaB